MNKNKTAKNSSVFGTRGFKAGTYSVISCAIVAVILIVINLIVNRLPASLTEYDITNTQLYTITEESELVARSVDTDINVYLIAETGSEHNTIVELLKRYSAQNDKIHVEYIDPAIYPNFVKRYTDAELQENSIIMEGNNRTRVITYDEIFVHDLSEYYTTGLIKSTFNGESLVTSALDYIGKEELPLIYTLTGHGEAALSETWVNYIKGQNAELESVSLLAESTDIYNSDCIIINSPTADYTEAETETIRKYLEKGGRMLLITSWTKEGQPNLMGLMEYYGLAYQGGIVIEGDANYCIGGYPNYVIPDIVSHEITDKLISNRTYILIPMAHGIRLLDEARDTLKVSALLDSSEKAYGKVAGSEMTTLDKEEGDLEGPFCLGAAVSEDYFGTNTKLVWIPSPYILDANFDTIVSGGNTSLVLSSLSWMLESDGAILSYAKNVGVESLLIPNNHKNALNTIFCAVIPLIIVGVGLLVWLRRIKK